MPVIERKPRWQHQRHARKLARARGERGHLLCFDPGCGKTRPTVEYIQELHLSGKANLVCVVNTLSGLYVWSEAWHEWADVPALFVDLRETGVEGLRIAQAHAAHGNLVICLINYGAAWRLGFRYVKKTKKVKGQDEPQVVSVLEPESDVRLDTMPWDVMVLDEIHKIKAPQSKVSLFFRTKVAPNCRIKIGLTGSLIKKKPGDAWAPVKFCTGDEIFPGPYMGSRENYAKSFCGIYGVPHPHLKGVIIAWTNLAHFAQRLALCSLVVAKEDCMDLPPQIHIIKQVTLNPKSRKVYDRLTKEMYTELDELEADGRREYRKVIAKCEEIWPNLVIKTKSTWGDDFSVREDIERNARAFIAHLFDGGVTAVDKAEALAKMKEHALSVKTVTVKHVFSVMRKQAQITSGYIVPDPPLDDPGAKMKPVPLGNEKVEAALEILEALWPAPTILTIVGNYEQEALAQAIHNDPRFLVDGKRFRPQILDGSVKGGGQARFDMMADAGKRGDPCFILKMQVGAESIDARWATNFILVTLSPDTIQYDQVIARNHRGGQNQTCTYYHLVAERTVDERIEEIIQGNLDVAKKVEKDWRSLVVLPA